MIVSIVIAVKKWQDNLAQCLARCQELEAEDLEIIVLPDEDFSPGLLPKGRFATAVIPTGPLNPAKKRDLALGHARGEIIALIDDDTYPKKDWLKNALGHFQDSQIAAVGGPAITPGEDSLRQKASGAVYASFLASGKFTYRYIPGRLQEVDDYPSCNFLVRKSVMLELGGFKTNFWPGEDTKLCLEITHILKQKIIYDPQVILFHHRRPLFLPHLRQVMSYALHRGYFVKRFPETSLRPYYFVPSIFLFFNILTGVAGLFIVPVRLIFLGALAVYLAVVLFASVVVSMRQKLGPGKLIQNAGLVILVFPGIVLTHIAYGSSFFQGLFSRRLKEEL